MMEKPTGALRIVRVSGHERHQDSLQQEWLVRKPPPDNVLASGVWEKEWRRVPIVNPDGTPWISHWLRNG